MLSRALIHLPACSTIAWLYVYDCISMIVCVWLYDKRRPMLSWRSQDYIQLVTVCNPQWLRMYEFMLVACRRSINIFVNSGTELWTQKCATRTPAYVFALRYMGIASHTHVQRHCMVVCAWFYLCDFMCLIVWQCAHDVMMMKTRSYTVSNGMSPNMIAFVSIHVGWHTWWGSGGLRSRCFFRFRRVPLQILVAVLEGSGADTWSASGGFLCRYLLRFVALVLVPLCSTIAWLYVYDCMTMCAWSHRENHMTTRGSNSVQSNMTPGKKWNKT